MPIVVYVDKYNGPPYSIRLGTCGSVGIEVLEFRFSPEWDGLQKRITFYANIGELAAPFLIPDSGILPLPAQATVKAGRYEAVIDGCGTDSRVIFSTSIMCEVLFHAPAGTSPPPEYTPDEYQQFISAVHGDRQRVSALNKQKMRKMVPRQPPCGTRNHETVLGGYMTHLKENTLIHASQPLEKGASWRKRQTRTSTIFLGTLWSRKGVFNYGYKMGIS